jgi:hypothetical protein
MVRGLPGLAALVVSLIGCASAYERTPLIVKNHGGVLVSNSPTLRDRPLPEEVDGALEVRYSLLVENQSAEPTVLHLTLALSQIAKVEDSVQTECQPRYGSPFTDVSLPPLARTRIDCRLRLTALGVQRLEQDDAPLMLAIPASRGGTAFAMGFAYLLFEGDAP